MSGVNPNIGEDGRYLPPSLPVIKYFSTIQLSKVEGGFVCENVQSLKIESGFDCG